MFGQALLIELFLGFHEFIPEKLGVREYTHLGFLPYPRSKVNRLWIMFDFDFHLGLH